MRRKNIFISWPGSLRATALAAAAFLIWTPLASNFALAQVGLSDDYLQGMEDGMRDAHAGALWFFAGFCLGGVGVLIAYLTHPTPSTVALMGKSQEYVQGYIEGYKSKSASKQGTLALYGIGAACLFSVVAYVIFIAIFAVAASSVDDDYDWAYE